MAGKNLLTSLSIACILSGCSTTPEALEKSASAARSEKSYAENYQEVYRRLADTARRCRSTTGSAAFTVDAQLYNELGYGEITMSMVSIYPRNYYWKAKVEKTASGSRVSAVSGNTSAQDRSLADVMRWADGDQHC
ncbi:hypothetical protein [Rhizobium leguminosarum]|uniref:hypothetical protein n=1 Tax=Rhizobium leguminosarum TaxID=384 RepID=UPI001C92664D|nr:hypothetical protein [Rhizobium leguminosarum]MBY3043700.1 hypothetical protein [Rhizobium leguminosarum]